MEKLLEKYDRILVKTREYFKKASKQKAVFGLSGGIDSALVAKLLADALGHENVLALIMPDKKNDKNVKDAIYLCELLGISYKVINIQPICKKILETIKTKDPIVRGNISARVRMVLLYAHANMLNALVVGTSNKTELTLGYFTKYGDGGCDLLPIGDLYKTEIFAISKLLGIPKKIITKRPSAGFWPGQTDETEIGMSYSKIDELLKKISTKTAVKLKNKKDLLKLIALIKKNKHKRKLPPVIK
ncbi:MAG: NAD+ synthase [Candidatus Diapherotrites archaeon]